LSEVNQVWVGGVGPVVVGRGVLGRWGVGVVGQKAWVWDGGVTEMVGEREHVGMKFIVQPGIKSLLQEKGQSPGLFLPSFYADSEEENESEWR
jgi:hypothetical protein